METPVQKMNLWTLKNFKAELENNPELSDNLDDNFDEIIAYEKEKMREIFIAGILIRDICYLDVNDKFDKLYYKLFQ